MITYDVTQLKALTERAKTDPEAAAVLADWLLERGIIRVTGVYPWTPTAASMAAAWASQQ